MQQVDTIDEMRHVVADLRAKGQSIAFVPTMGALHEGHLTLVDEAKRVADTVVMSVFVNPLQFGPTEDFARYPRTLDDDSRLASERGVDYMFTPRQADMYPSHAPVVLIHPGSVGKEWEGAVRPHHFEGVLTVVAKLFHIVMPDVAVFGRKDAQQCAVIERMVRDLDVPVRLVFGETMREPDGLAMSSRNSYLSPGERKLAPVLHRALRAGEEAITHGIHEVEGIEKLMRRFVDESGGAEVDYLAVIDPETFEAPIDFRRELLLAGAIRIGKTRLIDNIRVRP